MSSREKPGLVKKFELLTQVTLSILIVIKKIKPAKDEVPAQDITGIGRKTIHSQELFLIKKQNRTTDDQPLSIALNSSVS